MSEEVEKGDRNANMTEKEESIEENAMEDKFVLGGKEFKSRFILGSGKYNLNLIKAAVEQGGAEIITLALQTCQYPGE